MGSVNNFLWGDSNSPLSKLALDFGFRTYFCTSKDLLQKQWLGLCSQDATGCPLFVLCFDHWAGKDSRAMLGSMALLGGTQPRPTDVSYLKHLLPPLDWWLSCPHLTQEGKSCSTNMASAAWQGQLFLDYLCVQLTAPCCSPSDTRGMDSPTTTMCK